MTEFEDLPQSIQYPLKDCKLNEDNPRIIKDKKFDKLVASIKKFPKMLKYRPIVLNKDGIILGGNMRYRACIEAGLSHVPVIFAEDFTDAEQLEFIIKDNVGFGEWDFDILANEWSYLPLDDWGLDLPKLEDLEQPIDEQVAKVFKLLVVCSSEEEHERAYEKLIEAGYNVSKK